MDARKEIEQVKSAVMSQLSSKEMDNMKEEIRKSFEAKSEEEKQEFIKVLNASAKEECKKADRVYKDVALRIKLEKMLRFVSASYISETYFKKSRSWFTHRLNGNLVNGVPVSFTDSELETLRYALSDMCDTIKETARSI